MSITSLADIRHTVYINLAHRTDRKAHVEHELAKMGIQNPQRFNAIYNENGAIGCTMSHLAVLKRAQELRLPHILIVEDDILFTEPQIFAEQFARFQQSKQPWDVILFGGNNHPPFQYFQALVNSSLIDVALKVKRCQTTTGYLVNGHYIGALIRNISAGLSRLILNPTEHRKYAIDKYWMALQATGNWYLIMPLTVSQCAGYSDIECRNTDYMGCMLKR